jgi:hypothetical protein
MRTAPLLRFGQTERRPLDSGRFIFSRYGADALGGRA